MSYTKDALKGISWVAILRMCMRAISFLKTIILARILVPSQFGAYSVAFIVLGYLEVMTETGVNVILIQEKKSDKFIDSALIVSIIRGIIISLIILICTPFISNFFKSPDSAILLYTVSVVPFLRGFINPSIVKLQKQLLFKKEFSYRLSIFAVDTLVAIILTAYLKNPIGLIWGQIAAVLFEIFLSYKIVSPRPKFAFNKQYLNILIHRGKWVTASGMFNYLFHNFDNIVVGKLLGTQSLGIYQMAYSISILPITEIADVFSRVTFPIFSKISDDKLRLRRAFYKTFLGIIICSLPFGLLLFIFAHEIITIFLGAKWIAVVPILKVLAIFAILRTISGYTSTLFLAVGKQQYMTVVTFVSIIGLAIPIIPLGINFGLMGIAYSVLIASIIAIPFFLYYTIKILY